MQLREDVTPASNARRKRRSNPASGPLKRVHRKDRRRVAGSDISKVRPLPRDAEFLIEPEATVRNYDLVVDELQR